MTKYKYILIFLHKDIIEEYYNTIQLDNGAEADYLRFEKLIIKADRKISINFEIEDGNNDIRIYDYTLSKEYYSQGAVLYNLENHSICYLDEEVCAVLKDFIDTDTETMKLSDFDLVVEDYINYSQNEDSLWEDDEL